MFLPAANRFIRSYSCTYFLGLSVAEMIIFAYYTNRFHDKNREMSLLCAKTHFNKSDCIKISKDKGGNITLDIGDGANLYLKGYPFKKAFVAALIVRLIYYSEFTKQNKVEDFFKRH